MPTRTDSVEVTAGNGYTVQNEQGGGTWKWWSWFHGFEKPRLAGFTRVGHHHQTEGVCPAGVWSKPAAGTLSISLPLLWKRNRLPFLFTNSVGYYHYFCPPTVHHSSTWYPALCLWVTTLLLLLHTNVRVHQSSCATSFDLNGIITVHVGNHTIISTLLHDGYSN